MNVVNSSSLFYFARRLLNRYSPMCVGNACNLCNGNMSEYPMTHLPTLSRTRLFPPPRRIYISLSTLLWISRFFITCLFVCLFIFCDNVKEGPGIWGFGESKVVGKQKQKLTGYCVCVCVDPPEIVERPKDVAVRSGGIAAFYCRARGEPTPQLSWRKNGRKVSPAKRNI
jgi:netrin-G3 ligand